MQALGMTADRPKVGANRADRRLGLVGLFDRGVDHDVGLGGRLKRCMVLIPVDCVVQVTHGLDQLHDRMLGRLDCRYSSSGQGFLESSHAVFDLLRSSPRRLCHLSRVLSVVHRTPSG
jgi:hypothetical protein